MVDVAKHSARITHTAIFLACSREFSVVGAKIRLCVIAVRPVRVCGIVPTHMANRNAVSESDIYVKVKGKRIGGFKCSVVHSKKDIPTRLDNL